MEREVWVRAGMFAAIIVLVVLILATPSLMGHPSPLAPPLLIVGVTPDLTNLTVYVTASIQANLYDDITLNVTRLNAANESVAWTNYSEAYSYGIEVKVPLDLTYWRIHVWLRDEQKNYFEYNVSLRTYLDRNDNMRLTMAFTFPDDNSTTVVTSVPPDDFRVPVPRRGNLP